MNPFDFYIAHEYAFAATQLFLAMLGMGATLTPRDFLEVVRDPRGFSVGILLQIVGVPVVALLFMWALNLAPGVAVGLALCAAVPGGTVSNILTYLARGHVALSIALTAVATVACLLTTPIVLGWLIADYVATDFVMPAGRIALEIALYLMFPLLLGMLILRFVPAIAPRVSKYGIRGSLFVILLIVIGALGAGRIDLAAFGITNISIVVVFILTLACLSAWLPVALRLRYDDIKAINLEVTVRNTNLALLIKASLFPAAVGVADPLGDAVLFTILLYGGLMLLLGFAMISYYRRDKAQAMSSRSIS